MFIIKLPDITFDIIEHIMNRAMSYGTYDDMNLTGFVSIDDICKAMTIGSINYDLSFNKDTKLYGWAYEDFLEYGVYNAKFRMDLVLPDPVKWPVSFDDDKNQEEKSEHKSMSKEELFEIFHTMFPDFATYVTSYRKMGPRVLAINFDYGTTKVSRVFLYIDDNNWHFGTKLYRKNPRIKKNERMEKND